MTVQRPAPPFELDQRHEDGLEWRAVVDEDWSTEEALVIGKRCRYVVRAVRCPKPAEAVLWRPVWASDRPKRPWAYCGAHLYGRWLEDGQVVGWRAVEPD